MGVPGRSSISLCPRVPGRVGEGGVPRGLLDEGTAHLPNTLPPNTVPVGTRLPHTYWGREGHKYIRSAEKKVPDSSQNHGRCWRTKVGSGGNSAGPCSSRRNKLLRVPPAGGCHLADSCVLLRPGPRYHQPGPVSSLQLLRIISHGPTSFAILHGVQNSSARIAVSPRLEQPGSWEKERACPFSFWSGRWGPLFPRGA